MGESAEYWGVSSAIDMYECDLALMHNAEAIREFVKQLCERIAGDESSSVRRIAARAQRAYLGEQSRLGR